MATLAPGGRIVFRLQPTLDMESNQEAVTLTMEHHEMKQLPPVSGMESTSQQYDREAQEAAGPLWARMNAL